MTTKPYIDDAIRTHVDQQAKAQELVEQKRLTWLRTTQTWSTFVDGVCAEVAEDVESINTKMTALHGDAWIPLTVKVGGGVLLITTPVVTRQVWFYEETHLFKIADLPVAGQYPEISGRHGNYHVEKTEDGPFDVHFQDIKSSSKNKTDPAQDIVKPLIQPLLKWVTLHKNL